MTVEKPEALAGLSDTMIHGIRRMARAKDGRIDDSGHAAYAWGTARRRLIDEGYAVQGTTPAGRKRWLAITPKAAALLGWLSRYDQALAVQRAKDDKATARSERIHHAAGNMYDVIKTTHGMLSNVTRRSNTEASIFKAVSRIIDHVETDPAD